MEELRIYPPMVWPRHEWGKKPGKEEQRCHYSVRQTQHNTHDTFHYPYHVRQCGPQLSNATHSHMDTRTQNKSIWNILFSCQDAAVQQDWNSSSYSICMYFLTTSISKLWWWPTGRFETRKQENNFEIITQAIHHNFFTPPINSNHSRPPCLNKVKFNWY